MDEKTTEQQSNEAVPDVHDKWRPNRKLARAIGIMMIVIGALSFYTIVGIFEIVIGVGVVKFKRRSLGNAVTLMWVEVIGSSIVFVGAIVAFLVLMYTIRSGNMSKLGSLSGAEYLIGKCIEYAIYGLIGLVISVPLLILLKRSSVEQAFLQSPPN
jgi:hypothetical protein